MCWRRNTGRVVSPSRPSAGAASLVDRRTKEGVPALCDGGAHWTSASDAEGEHVDIGGSTDGKADDGEGDLSCTMSETLAGASRFFSSGASQMVALSNALFNGSSCVKRRLVLATLLVLALLAYFAFHLALILDQLSLALLSELSSTQAATYL